ncbi:MAG: sulfur carrier protein ThiS [Paraclostridium sp.]
MKVNGKEFEFKSNTNISNLLDILGIEKDRVVVEINLEIIENEQYDTYVLKEDDFIEIIRFVGGG